MSLKKRNLLKEATWAIVLVAGTPPAQGGEVPFTEREISTAADRANSVFAADVDGDGDTDVLSASENDDKIAWYENDGGSPPSFTERVISEAADFATSVFATDVDGDGDTDVLSGTFLPSKIAWWESDGGSPPSFTERVLSTGAIGDTSVFATDVDGDGDTDVLSTSEGDDEIAWYEQLNLADPLDPDTDDDGLLDGVETNTGVFVDANDTGTDPQLADTDGDGFDDGAEVAAGTDPTDPLDFPAPPIPAVGPWGLGLLAALLGVFAASRLRRRAG